MFLSAEIMCISYNCEIKPRDNNQEKQTSPAAKNKLMPKLPVSAPKSPYKWQEVMLFLVPRHGYLTSLLICHLEHHHHLTKNPVDFFFLKRVVWGMNSSKYIMRFWHVQRLQLLIFSVINSVFLYWHAMGNLGGICSALNQSSYLCGFFFRY